MTQQDAKGIKVEFVVPEDQKLVIEILNLRPTGYDGPHRATFDAKLVLPGGQGHVTIKNYKLMKRGEPGGYWVAPPSTRKDRGPNFFNFVEMEGIWTNQLVARAVAVFTADGREDTWTPPEIPFYPERPEDKPQPPPPPLSGPRLAQPLLPPGRLTAPVPGYGPY